MISVQSELSPTEVFDRVAARHGGRVSFSAAVGRCCQIDACSKSRRCGSRFRGSAAAPILASPAATPHLEVAACRYTPYDAAYVALAEALDVVLVTDDGRLSRASGVECEIEAIGAAGRS